jgi:hypothetical protein
VAELTGEKPADTLYLHTSSMTESQYFLQVKNQQILTYLFYERVPVLTGEKQTDTSIPLLWPSLQVKNQQILIYLFYGRVPVLLIGEKPADTNIPLL